MDGLKIIEELRKKKNSTPVIMLTARDTVDDKGKVSNSELTTI